MKEREKRCIFCGNTLPLKNFVLNPSTGVRSDVCKKCSEQMREQVNEVENKRRKGTILPPKLVKVVADMQARMKEYRLNPARVAQMAAPHISTGMTAAVLSNKLTNEPKLSTIEALCDPLDLELYMYVVPKTYPRNAPSPLKIPRDENGNIATKVCSICGKAKPVTDFNHNVNSPDGYHIYCKECCENEQ